MTYEGKVAGPEHRVSLDTALRAITIEAAYSIQLEKKVGSIEVGKDANLTILEKNPFDVDPAELKGIGVWGTMLEGRLQPVVRKAPTASTDRRQPSPVVADSEVQSATVRQLERVLADRHGF